jgi:hypothetical protein
MTTTESEKCGICIELRNTTLTERKFNNWTTKLAQGTYDRKLNNFQNFNSKLCEKHWLIIWKKTKEQRDNYKKTNGIT